MLGLKDLSKFSSYDRRAQSKFSKTLLKRQGISQGRTGRGVIEDAPSGTIGRRPGKFLGEPFDLVRTVFRIINARSTVQPKVKKPVPSALAGSRTYNGWIRRGTSEPEFPQQAVGARREPVWVAGLAHHRSAEASAQTCEERAGRFQVKTETGRKLKQDRAERVAKSACLPENSSQCRICTQQAQLMRILFRCFDGKGKTLRHRGRPALISRSPMRPIEG
jgi:hypothetical protein